MGLTSLLDTARNALAAQSYGLNVAGQNVANAGVAGYARREALLATRALGANTTGTVDVVGLRRVTNQWTDRRLLEASSLASGAASRDDALGGVEALFDDASGTGFGSSLDALFASFGTLASNPSDLTTRSTVLARATAFAGRVRDTAEALTSQRSDLYQRAQATALQINTQARTIARLNDQIHNAQALGHDAADLEEERDHALTALAALADVRTFVDGQGDLVVQSAGTTLVEGNSARGLSVDLDASGNVRLWATPDGGGAATEVTRGLGGGSLHGLIEARDVDLAGVLSQLDQLAYDVATALNAQHRTGYGLDGSTGRDLFTAPTAVAGAARALTLDAALAGRPDRLAASSSATTLPGDGSAALALSRLASSPLAAGGTSTASDAYASLVGDVATRKASAEDDRSTRDAMASQVQAMRESDSGVSLDDEMVSLSKYQRAYEAASKVLATVDQLLAELMQRVG